MYQINLTTYNTDIKAKNARRILANKEKRFLGRKFTNIAETRTALMDFFKKNDYTIGKDITEKDECTFVRTLLFGNKMIKTEYAIVKCSSRLWLVSL